MADNDFAIVAGITNYPKISNLRGPETDADNFYKWLIGTGDGEGNVPEGNIVKIVTSQFDKIDPDWADPSVERLERRLHDLKLIVEKHVNEKGQARRLYLFLAGHGLTRDIDGGALLAANANYDDLCGMYVEGRLYADWFRLSGFFGQIVLLMDCCREDYPQAPERRPFWPEKKDAVAAANVRTFYGYATKFSARARERELPAGSQRFQGLFTRALMDALDNANRNGRGDLTGEAVKNYIYAHLKVLSTATQPQDPRIVADSGRDIVWCSHKQPADVSFRIMIDPPTPDQIQLEDPGLNSIGTFAGNAPFERLHIPNGNGTYNLRFADGREIGFDVAAVSAEPLVIQIKPGEARERQVSYVQG